MKSPVLLIAAALVLPPVASHAKTPLPGCDLGWYVVEGAALLEPPAASSLGAADVRTGAHSAGTSTHGRVVSLAEGHVSIEGICPTTTATVRHKRNRTKVVARWDDCSGVTGPVQLRAAIDASDCMSMRGTVMAKKMRPKKRQDFGATRTLGNPADCTADNTFDVIEKRIFGPKGCRVAACHGDGTSGGLDLRYGAAHFSLVNQPATGAPGKTRVVPGDPEASFLWQKLTGHLADGEGTQMPAGGAAPLDALELEMVRTWIVAGAPAVGRVDDAPCLPHPQFEPVTPPDPPAGGYQLHFVGPVLQPGQEVEGCMWTEAPNPEEFAVGSWEYFINPGSHHFAVWQHENGGPPPLGVFEAGDIACFRHGAPTDGRSMSGSPEAPYYVDAYPPGIGRVLAPHELIGMNPHYFNEFDVPVQVEGWINMHPVIGGLQHPVETLFSGAGNFEGQTAYSINVPPFATGSLRLRMVNTLGVPMKIFHVSSHQHQRGTHFTAWTSNGTKIFENYDWAHPAILTFEDDAPFVLAPNDYLDYQCEWDNGVTRPVRRCGESAADTNCTPGDPKAVTFGLTAQDEMCYLVGFYYTD
jgi:hypothetical protein